METFYLASRFACNLSNRGRFVILDIVLVKRMMVPRQRKLLGDADGSRLYLNWSARTMLLSL